MVIMQEAFEIPTDIMTKILTGEYRRIGGVVRHAIGQQKGQIVKHLKSVDLKDADQAQKVGAKMIKFANNKKIVFIILVATASAATVGAGIYHKMKNRELEAITNFRSALKDYITAVRTGKMNVNVIDKLMDSLEKLKKHKDYEKISIQLSTEELDVLVYRIYDYTRKLAKDNYIELSDEENVTPGGSVMNLQKCY